MRIFWLTIILTIGVISSTASTLLDSSEEERILNYFIELNVHPTGKIDVIEKIKVRANGLMIQRGIYRTIPLDYYSENGNAHHLYYDINSIMMDGKEIEYSDTEDESDLIIKIGSEDVILDPGIYEYTIAYSVYDQIGFFEEFDELYWNAIGTEWDFKIDQAQVIVKTPNGVTPISSSSYSGNYGSSSCLECSKKVNLSNVEFYTKNLNEQEGFTVGVSWEKGIVIPPNTIIQFFKNTLLYSSYSFLSLLFLSLLCYYLIVWFIKGRDPKKGIITPIFHAPKGWTPSKIRFLYKKKLDTKNLTAELINIAVNGGVKIKQENGTYVIQRLPEYEQNLPEESKNILRNLFSGLKEIKLNSDYKRQFSSTLQFLKLQLKEEIQGVFFKRNTIWFSLGIWITIISLVFNYRSILTSGDVLPITIWMLTWTLGGFFMVRYAIGAFKTVGRSRDYIYLFKTVALSIIFTLPQIIFFGFLFTFEATVYIQIMGIISLHIIFRKLLIKLTPEGKKIHEELEGFKLYLTMAENDILKLQNKDSQAPSLTFSEYESKLPYALAFDLEVEWAEKFSAKLGDLFTEKIKESTWYSGNRVRRFSDLSKELSESFTTDLKVHTFDRMRASSSRSSRSSGSSGSGSSGSSGSGFSGGGGGGGGGGGW